MPELIVVRHGATELNDTGRLRGWMDPPLSEAGFRHAQMLAGMSLPKTVFCSDLLRARQTAEYIGAYWAVSELRPWNVGIYQGRPTDVVHPKLVQYTREPTVRVPFGEPYAEFAERLLKFVLGMRCNATLVTHYRCCKLLKAMEANGYESPDIDVLLSDDVSCGDVLTLRTP